MSTLTAILSDQLADLIWVVWVTFGLIVCWKVLHESLKDLHFVQALGMNGLNERDAWETVVQNCARVGLQVVFLATGIWRLFLPPDFQWWSAVNKMTVATLAVTVATSVLSWMAIRDLRWRRVQIADGRERRAGTKRTRWDDPS